MSELIVKLASLLINPSFIISKILGKSFLSLIITFPLSLYPLPVTSNDFEFGKVIILAVCSLTVKVPVLSLAIKVQLPSDSTEFNFLTITFFFNIRLLAIDKAIVRASGNPSGKADKVRATTNIKTSFMSLLFVSNIIVKIIARIKTIILICLENFSTRIVKGDFSSRDSVTVLAICPISV